MTTVFSRIINGEIPGRFAYADQLCVVFATIEPIAPGHMLVVPRQEVDAFVDTDDDLLAHLMMVAKRVGLAQQAAYPGTRAVMMIAGFDVPHLHLHVLSLAHQSAMTFANARAGSGDDLDAACEAVRAGLVQLGFGGFVPNEMAHL
ncbi:MAG: HIT family protein [Propionibacteriaceae bacterium]|nr:HIT family protein [Propionibacteriaceae bacterium]